MTDDSFLSVLYQLKRECDRLAISPPTLVFDGYLASSLIIDRINEELAGTADIPTSPRICEAKIHGITIRGPR